MIGHAWDASRITRQEPSAAKRPASSGLVLTGFWFGVPPLGQVEPIAADRPTAHLADGGDGVVGRPSQVGWLAVADPAG
jgi:hypothetical protein